MYAVGEVSIGEDDYGLDTISIKVEELPSEKITETMYMDNAKQRFRDYDSIEYSDKKIIAGDEYHTLLCKNSEKTTTICCRRIKNYMVTVLINQEALSSCSVDEILGFFSEY